MSSNTRVVFMGTSAYAVPVLKALSMNSYTIPLVITQPDRRRGRNKKKTLMPVNQLAEELGLTIYQPGKIREHFCYQMLEEIAPDLIITASYGQILRKKHLEIPKYGVLNVHASILPELRGAAPIQYAIIRGKTKTGVTIMKTDIGVDTGPVLSYRETAISSLDTAGTLEPRLAQLGADLLIDTIPGYLAGNILPVEQNHTKATHAGKITTEDARIDWSESATVISCKIRGMNPYPGAFTMCNKQRLKIHFATVIDSENSEYSPGTILSVVNGKGVTIQTGNGVLLIEEIQPASKKKMCADALIQGRISRIGEVI